MLKIFKKKKAREPISIPALEFNFAIGFVKEIFEYEKSDNEKIIILDFMVNVIKEDLKAELLSYIFYSDDHFSRDLRYPFPLFYCDEHGNERSLPQGEMVEVDLVKDTVLVMPWHHDRLRIQIKNIFSNDFVYEPSNHKAYYFPYIGLCYVYNGKHSVSCGIVHKKGAIRAETYDITKLFPHINTDGKHWYNCHNGERKGELADFRLGIIYELARMKHEIENNLTT